MIDYNIIISSFLAGSVQTILGHPLDTIKTRIQIDNSNIKKVIKNIKLNENYLHLYKGAFMPLIGTCILNSFLFSYHYNLNNIINNHFISGFYTGLLNGIILSPFELIKCKFQNNRTKKKNKLYNIFKSIKNKEILLYNGVLLSALRDSIGISIYFGTYETFQKYNNNPLINGGLAGCLSWIYSYPIDVIKTKKQISNNNISNIIKHMKPQNYINGISIVIIRAFIVNSGIFYTYEQINKSLKNF